jgi:hypothetical protein
MWKCCGGSKPARHPCVPHFFAAPAADIPPKLQEAKNRADEAWVREADRIGDAVYDLPEDFCFPEFNEYNDLWHEAGLRSIYNCYKNNAGYRAALEQELTDWGITVNEFFEGVSSEGEWACDFCTGLAFYAASIVGCSVILLHADSCP